MGQANNSSTFGTAPSVFCALTPHQAVQPPQVCHRLETGQSPLARTCGRTWTFLKRPPCLGAPSPLHQIVHVRNLDQKNGGNLPYEMGLGTCFSERVFHAPPGAKRFSGQMMQKSKEKQHVLSKFCYHQGPVSLTQLTRKPPAFHRLRGK